MIGTGAVCELWLSKECVVSHSDITAVAALLLMQLNQRQDITEPRKRQTHRQGMMLGPAQKWLMFQAEIMCDGCTEEANHPAAAGRSFVMALTPDLRPDLTTAPVEHTSSRTCIAMSATLEVEPPTYSQHLAGKSKSLGRM